MVKKGGITAVKGFFASGLHCGIKKKKEPDLALIFSDVPAITAGVFTTNRFQAPGIKVTRRHLNNHLLQAVLINSGNANVFNGKQGYHDTETLARFTAQKLRLKKDLVGIASTGVISAPLPIKHILPKISQAIQLLSPKGSSSAARAIMTTDKTPKETAHQIRIKNHRITIGGIAKGSGMIHPHMATMLCFLTTDARVSPKVLQKALGYAVDHSFNLITVDGCMSPNDQVLCMANGKSNQEIIPPSGPIFNQFTALLLKVCRELAQMIVRDGEGATKFIEIKTIGAPSVQAAKKICMSVASSALVKTALFGADPNWGRIMSAIGSSGVRVSENKIDILFGKKLLVKGGEANPRVPENSIRPYLKGKEIAITLHLHSGKKQAVIWTCDFSYDYVKINASYRS